MEASAIKAEVTDWQTKARDRERFRTLLRQCIGDYNVRRNASKSGVQICDFL